MTNMKLIQALAVGYTGFFAILGVFSRFVSKNERNLPTDELSEICFVQRERVKATKESPSASTAIFSLAEKNISTAEAVSFSMQLAILQQSVHRANIPCHVPVPVRKHHFATT